MEKKAPSQDPDALIEAKKAKRVLGVVVLFFLSINAAILLLVLQTPKPTYQGKTVTQWLATRVTPEVINAFGPDAASYLVKPLHEKNSGLKRYYIAFWPKLPRFAQENLKTFRPVDSAVLSMQAREWLRELGPDAKEAIPDLIKIVRQGKNPAARLTAIQALGFVGLESDEALQALVGVLRGPETVWNPISEFAQRVPAALRPSSSFGLGGIGNVSLNDGTAPAIARFGARAKPAVPFLAERIKRRTDGRSLNLVNALGEIGPEAKEAVPVLLELLKDPRLRQNALGALARIGEEAESAVPSVVRLLDEDDLRVRSRAIEILCNVGPSATPALALLRKLESNKVETLRIQATVAVARIEQNPTHALPILTNALDLEGTFARGIRPFTAYSERATGLYRVGTGIPETSAWLLGESGREAESALPALERATTSTNRWLRILAARAIWKITQRDDKILLLLEQCKAAKVNRPVLTFLPIYEELGPRAKVVSPELVGFIHDQKNKWSERREVLRVLRQIDPERAATVSLR